MLHGLTRAQVRTELNLFRSFVGLYILRTMRPTCYLCVSLMFKNKENLKLSITMS